MTGLLLDDVSSVVVVLVGHAGGAGSDAVVLFADICSVADCTFVCWMMLFPLLVFCDSDISACLISSNCKSVIECVCF